jgi:hypothetical protein
MHPDPGTQSNSRNPYHVSRNLTEARVRFRFAHQPVPELEKPRISQLRAWFTELAVVIARECPHNDYSEKSVALIEDAAAAAVKSISHGQQREVQR